MGGFQQSLICGDEQNIMNSSREHYYAAKAECFDHYISYLINAEYMTW
jgi:hypothetical protein